LEPTAGVIISVLDIPEDTNGMIITNQSIWRRITFHSKIAWEKLKTIPINQYFVYIPLPKGASRVKIADGVLEINETN
jgi:hypothetical protein